MVSAIGDGLVVVAMPLLAAALTSDARLVAGVAVAQRLPWLLLSLHGGALVDRLSLRRLLPGVEVTRGVVLLVLASVVLMGQAALPLLYIAAFVIGCGDTLISSGLHAAIPRMVAPSWLNKANGRILASQVTGGEFIGPAIGGVLFAVAAALPFLVDGLSFLVSAVLLALVLPGRGPDTTPRTTRIGEEVMEGLRWFAGNPVLRLLAVVIGAFALFQAGVLALLVLLAIERLGMPEAAFGALLAVGAVGNLLGAALAERLDRVRISATVLVAGGVTAASYVVMGLTTSPWLAGAAFLIEGVAIAAANVVTVSLRQQIIPQSMLGRVGSAFRLCIFGTMPVGALVAGFLGNAIGVGPAIAAMGAGQIVVLVLAAPAALRLLGDQVLSRP